LPIDDHHILVRAGGGHLRHVRHDAALDAHAVVDATGPDTGARIGLGSQPHVVGFGWGARGLSGAALVDCEYVAFDQVLLGPEGHDEVAARTQAVEGGVQWITVVLCRTQRLHGIGRGHVVARAHHGALHHARAVQRATVDELDGVDVGAVGPIATGARAAPVDHSHKPKRLVGGRWHDVFAGCPDQPEVGLAVHLP